MDGVRVSHNTFTMFGAVHFTVVASSAVLVVSIIDKKRLEKCFDTEGESERDNHKEIPRAEHNNIPLCNERESAANRTGVCI